MTPAFLHTSTNHLRLRKYQRLIEHHNPNTYREHYEWVLIHAYFMMPRKKRERLALSFPWLNMEHTTFI